MTKGPHGGFFAAQSQYQDFYRADWLGRLCVDGAVLLAQENHVSNSTFSGPLRAGPIANSTGTTLGVDVANVGQTIMAQTANVTQASDATTIVIPANSHITRISFWVRVAWSGAASTLGMGTTALATAFTAAAAVAGGTVGLVTVTPGTDATRTAAFNDVGTTDVKLRLTSTNTGAGVGTLTVEYMQNVDLL